MGLLICARIIYVSSKPLHREVIVDSGAAVEYNGMKVRLNEFGAVTTEQYYRMVFDLSIRNEADEIKEFTVANIAVYNGAIHNGVGVEDIINDLNLEIEPDTERLMRYYWDVPITSVTQKTWDALPQKAFKIMLTGYEEDIGWEVNPKEHEGEQIAENKQNKKMERLSEADFYRTQAGAIGEEIECLWTAGLNRGSDWITVQVKVKEVNISKTISENWNYVFDDIGKYGTYYSPVLPYVEREDNQISNEYTAVEVCYEFEAEEEALLSIDDLQLYYMNSELFPVKDIRYNPCMPVFGGCAELEFLRYDMMNNCFVETDEISRQIKLHEGKNEVTLVYIVPDVCTNSMEYLYIARLFIGVGNDGKEHHNFTNEGLLIQLVQRIKNIEKPFMYRMSAAAFSVVKELH